MRIGYTTGVFDMFHIGHLNILKMAKEMCDFLIVGVTTDELCEQRKGKKPIIPFEERVEIIKSIRYVDKVVPQTNMDKMAAQKECGFNLMFVGSDWQASPEWKSLEMKMAEVGAEIVYFPYTNSTSSTKLRECINKSLLSER